MGNISPTDAWAAQVHYKGSNPLCSKQDCGRPATRVAFASPSFRILTCAVHEDECMALVKQAKSAGPYTGSMPPAEYTTWVRHHREWYDGYVAPTSKESIVP